MKVDMKVLLLYFKHVVLTTRSGLYFLYNLLLKRLGTDSINNHIV